jgi:predicted CxxxxCH...CXXCH cytochrome family protein
MCHGGTANATGAPPKATWGNTLPADRTNVRIGAHTVHAAGTTSSPAIACTVCHPAHTSALDAGHLDGGTATVVLGGLSGGGTWDRATGTCSGTYCHDGGRFGNDKAPTWTAAGPAACTSCHLAPPDDVGHNFHSFRSIPCSGCHGATTATRADPAYHVNGAKDVLYHGARISTGWSSCTGCHN